MPIHPTALASHRTDRGSSSGDNLPCRSPAYPSTDPSLRFLSWTAPSKCHGDIPPLRRPAPRAAHPQLGSSGRGARAQNPPSRVQEILLVSHAHASRDQRLCRVSQVQHLRESLHHSRVSPLRLDQLRPRPHPDASRNPPSAAPRERNRASALRQFRRRPRRAHVFLPRLSPHACNQI
jgi:hypothetical protein